MLIAIAIASLQRTGVGVIPLADEVSQALWSDLFPVKPELCCQPFK